MSVDTAVQFEIKGSIARLRLNRPKQLNTLTVDMVVRLLAVFDELRGRTDVRVVVLSGAGEHFCAGLDLKQSLPVLAGNPADAMRFMQDFGDVVLRMRACPQPIVCLLQGAAAGGGLALALASDIRLGTPCLRMNAAFVRLGLSGTEMGVSWLLPRLVGASRAAELLMTGRFVSGAEALSIGLLSRLTSVEELESVTAELVDTLLLADPLGLRLTKEALHAGCGGGSLEAAIAFENRNQALCFASGSVRAGVEAFVAKRVARARQQS